MGNRFGQLLMEFFRKPVTAVVNQLRRGSLDLALIIMAAAIFLKITYGLIFGLAYRRLYIDFWFFLKNLTASFFGEVFFLGTMVLGLYVFTMLITNKSLDIRNSVVAVGCSALLLPVANFIGIIPIIGPVAIMLARYMLIFTSVFALQEIEGIEDKNKMAYVAIATMISHYLLSSMLHFLLNSDIPIV